MRLAALTMAYNEPVWARVWARYYARQVGAAHCYLIDHGSDDGSTDGLGIRVERIERTALDEDARAELVMARTASLLRDYDAVVHSDADEVVVADPERFSSLAEFAAACGESVVTTIGLDLQHLPDEEAALDPAAPLIGQRRWVRFSAAMCKPAFVRRPVRWSPGFHSCDAPVVAGGLYLLHLRYADLALGLRRLERTRQQAFASPAVNLHQRVSDDVFAHMIRSIGQLPKEEFARSGAEGSVATWFERVRAAQGGGPDWLSIAGDRLWRLPESWAML